MKRFEFHAELFDLRNSLLEALSDKGFAWLSDFGSIDLCHDTFGLEVCAIRDKNTAKAIKALVHQLFPTWRHRRFFYEDQNVREIGWKIIISRDPEEFDDRWQTAN